MKKLIAIVLTSALLTQFVPAVSAKPKGDWDAVKVAANRAVAVKTKSGKTHFGLIRSIDDSGLTMILAGSDEVTSQIIDIRRDEVGKVWRATLRFDEDNLIKGGWIGAGVGVGTLMTIAAVKTRQDSSDPVPVAVLLPMLGAGAGAVIGSLWKKKHKKHELVYSI